MIVPTKLIELFSRQELELTQKQAEQLDRYGDPAGRGGSQTLFGQRLAAASLR